MVDNIKALEKDLRDLQDAIDEGLDFLTVEYFRVEGELLEAKALMYS